MTATEQQDATMAAITEAVERGRAGDTGAARAALLRLWPDVLRRGDALHACTLAHHLADLYDDAADALAWDVRALDAADRLDDERARRHHPGLEVRGFYPSLHLNLADNYRRLGSFTAARGHLDAARTFLDALPDDNYGQLVRRGIDEVGAAIRSGSTERRESAPDGRG